MDQKEEKTSLGRRDFLKVATVGAAAGAVVVAASGKAEAAVVSEQAEASNGYSETGHVAKYYELANF